jgi:hypothetical protein
MTDFLTQMQEVVAPHVNGNVSPPCVLFGVEQHDVQWTSRRGYRVRETAVVPQLTRSAWRDDQAKQREDRIRVELAICTGTVRIRAGNSRNTLTPVTLVPCPVGPAGRGHRPVIGNCKLCGTHNQTLPRRCQGALFINLAADDPRNCPNCGTRVVIPLRPQT